MGADVETVVVQTISADLVSCVSRDDWLAKRTQGIGASEAAGVCGASRYRDSTPLAIWARKRGLAPPVQETMKMRFGTMAEPFVVAEYVRQTGRTIGVPAPFSLYRSKVRPWQLATPDRFVHDPVKGWGVMEIKTTGERNAAEWSEGAPREYLIQVAHQLAVLGLSWTSLCVLIGNASDLRWIDLDRDEKLEGEIVKLEEAFMASLASGEEPKALGADNPVLALLHPKELEKGLTVALPPEFADLDGRRIEVEATIEKATDEKADIDARIKQAIGENHRGVLPNGVSYSWTEQERKAYPVAPSKSRVLRRHDAARK